MATNPTYDEFGQYVLDDDEDVAEESEEVEERVVEGEGVHAEGDEGSPATMRVEQQEPESKEPDTQIILQKEMFPSAATVYPGAETMVQDEDTQDLTQPIIAPISKQRHDLTVDQDAEPERATTAPISAKKVPQKESGIPETTFNKQFLIGMLDHPEMIRNVALIGDLHHGKTSLMDLFVEHTHLTPQKPRFTDTRMDEQDRRISVKCSPMSLVMPALSGKSYLLHLMDTPGHVNFSDEVTAALRLADGAVLVVDQVPLAVCLNKIDRLVLELKLPPADAYHKIRQVLDELNTIASQAAGGLLEPATSPAPTPASPTAPLQPRLSPELGNVCFASSQFHFVFTLQSMARHYGAKAKPARAQPAPDRDESEPPVVPSFDPAAFASRLWGDICFDPATRRFQAFRGAPPAGAQRSFVQFVLEPLYKILGQSLGESEEVLAARLAPLGVHLSKAELSMDPEPLLRTVCRRFFKGPAPFVDLCVHHLPSPVAGAQRKLEYTYTGPMDSPQAEAMRRCDPEGPLMLNVTKLFSTADAKGFRAYGRVLSGTIRPGMAVRVLGEQYRPPVDTEDAAPAVVAKTWLLQARYRVEVPAVPAGNWVLLDGVDKSIFKTATLAAEQDPPEFDTHIFRPLQFNTQAAMKVAVEPLNPKDLPKMVEGLRAIRKSFPVVESRVEESGEHVIFGTGELALDCVLHDLREMYGLVEIKVSDPFVALCETVVEKPTAKCFAETPNKRNRISITAEPLDKGLAADIEQGAISLACHGDLPRHERPNVFVDDTLPSEVNPELIADVRPSIVQGFQWGTRQALCDEPMREVKFRLIDATIDESPAARYPTQIVPTARRACYTAFLLATPRLMEPVYYVYVQAPADCVPAVYTVLSRRRGHVTQDLPRPGNPFYAVHAYLPVLESFGFETDLRVHTQGQAFCQCVFDHWSLVPGDPLDKSIVLTPLAIAEPQALSRELMVKTRRRKGLSEDVVAAKFLDEAMLTELAQQEVDLKGLQ
ncbi:putative small nuclear ribonucleoprotein component [Paratrimastix pyriformis]|uniref:Small nuclear ribonucleoprotein component n=1 Tax=Paratrimastix pyriformis TaxID=342808 RepID=A0ABQ8UKZ9_9EUKA|nr:putative small nuclear ribonucleoprotein component [Paratrimastix pyriformis]